MIFGLCFTRATRWMLDGFWAVRVGIDMFSSSEGNGAKSAGAVMPRYALYGIVAACLSAPSILHTLHDMWIS